jgi:hypothetical protein
LSRSNPKLGSHIFGRVGQEINQGHEIRVPCYEHLTELLQSQYVPVAFFTSLVFEAPIMDQDADMLEEILQNTELKQDKKLMLVLNSPGGDGLAAERIVNICRSYSPKGFSVIVLKMAKSAATMICFGAEKIHMSRSSELGPIDPQIPIYDDSGRFMGYQAAHELIESYDELMKQAGRTTGRMEPYLQQLARFDARNLRRIKSAQSLTESIAIKCLKTGTFKRLSESKIKRKIGPFLDPNFTRSHGRPIYHDVVSSCGLDVELHDVRSDLWREVWSLYVRLNYLVSSVCGKVAESGSESYIGSRISSS